MKSSILLVAKKSTIYLVIFALIAAFTLNFTPTQSYASSSSINLKDVYKELNDDSFELLEMIEQTDKEVVYKTLENGVVYLYEEYIDNDLVTTNKYKLDNTTRELVESFTTLTVMNGENISVTQKDLLSNKVISQTTVEVSPVEEVLPVKEVIDDKSINAYNKWVKTRSGGNNYAYYMYNNGGGKARAFSDEKTVSSYNKAFNQFTKDVDKIKSFESGILWEFTVIGVLDKAFKAIKKPTIANITSFLKRYVKAIPGIAVIVAFIQYFGLINKAIISYKSVPGTERRWR